MSDTVRGFLTLVCALVVVIPHLLYLLKGNTKDLRLKQKAEQSGSVTIGTVVKSEYVSHLGERNDYQNAVVTYVYEVDGKEYRLKKIFGSKHMTVNYPDEIKIYYDPKNPSRAIDEVVTRKGSQYQKGCLFVIGEAILIMFVVAQILKHFA